MSDEYWKKHYQATSTAPGASLLTQVGKTINGADVSEEQIRLITESIKTRCKLVKNDTVLDLCCGNGLLTTQIANAVRSVVGVDFSPGLIATAKQYSPSANVAFICENILEMDEALYARADKIIMYEALQHFSTEGFQKLALLLQKVSNGTCIFIGSVPDRDKLSTFYDTNEKMEFYMQREKSNKPHMGRWWQRQEIHAISQQHGLSARFLHQEPRLYTAFYRFDVLMEKSE